MQFPVNVQPQPQEKRKVGQIPVRNIWLLFLYASNLARFYGHHLSGAEEAPDFPALIGRLLCYAVERRLRRNLSRGYQEKRASLSRVRGRIDILQTFAGDLQGRGKVACRFEEFTFNTPRNRLVRAALDALSTRVDDQPLRRDCIRLALDLGRQGVSGTRPSHSELSTHQLGRNDSDDLLMVTLAHLVFDLILPMEDFGDHTLTRVEKDAMLVRHLFEKAIGNFYAFELQTKGWKVFQGRKLEWQIENSTTRIADIMPGMTSDIILEELQHKIRIVIDTKFTSVFGTSQYRDAVLKSAYVYQLYTYLRSQERQDDNLSYCASGMFIHPTVDHELDETVRIQGHDIRFATVDLTLTATQILQRLRELVPNP